jgi:hypothetical protein
MRTSLSVAEIVPNLGLGFKFFVLARPGEAGEKGD